MNISDLLTSHLGEVLSLTTAITWAFAVILFKKSGETVHPIALNQFKNIMAAVLLIPTMWAMSENFLPDVTVNDYLILLVSGALGIAIADTLFFKSLNRLGAGRSAIVDCLYSPFIIGLSIIWLGESLSFLQVVGALLIISAVLSITGERSGDNVDRRQLLMGITWGVLAMATMAVGIVMVKPLLDKYDLLWVTLVRLIGGVLTLFAYLAFHPNRRAIVRSVTAIGHRGYTISGSVVGGYISMILWLGGMKFTQASTAAALNQTSGIFVFIFAAIILKERITHLRLAAITLGIAGAIMVGTG